ncbi:MAG: exonuclease domain-containing protein [Phycisphaerales bacterium JB052]
MTSPNPDFFVFIDIETTGLDPHFNVPLEVALLLVDPHTGKTQGFLHVLCDDDKKRYTVRISDFCTQMHLESGLLGELKEHGGRTFDETDQLLSQFIIQNNAHGSTLAGNSVHFDRGFINAYFPRTAAILHYRNMDTSSLERLIHEAGLKLDFEKPTNHRAMDDINYSARVYKTALALMACAEC